MAGTFTITLVTDATLKAFIKAFTEKLTIKLAVKVGTRAGMKRAAASTGAGVSATACSWAGPAAIACAVIEGTITWVGMDMAMIKLDEHIARDDFERDLRNLIMITERNAPRDRGDAVRQKTGCRKGTQDRRQRYISG